MMNVDYEAMPAQAKQIREAGKQLNNEMTKAYQSVAEMHEVWYGTRYNELVKSFNEIVAPINEILSLVVTEIPYAMEKIANNYAQVDKGSNVTSASNEQPNKISSIAVINDVGLKYEASTVSTLQKQISTNFSNAKEQMNKIEAECESINWSGEAANAFKTKMSKLKSSIVSAFENLNTQFTKLMAQTQQDMERANNANTVN